MSVLVDKSRCIACGKCVEVCPGDLLALASEGCAFMRDKADCWDCMACVKECPRGALSTRLPYSLADYTALLKPVVYPDKIVWTCIDVDGNREEFEIKTLGF